MRLLCVAIALLIGAGCSNSGTAGSTANSPVIEIASDFPLQGPNELRAWDQAVNVAVAERPTIGGYRLVHVSMDDSLGGGVVFDRVLQNIRRAVREPAILGVVGPQTSPEAAFLIPQAAPANLVLLSPSNTVDCLTDPVTRCLTEPIPNTPRNYFRLAARDTLDAKAAADLAFHRLGVTRFAVLANPLNNPRFGRAMADAFAKEVVLLGGKVVYSHDITDLDQSFAPVLRDAKAAGADAIYLSAGDDPTCAVRHDMQGIFPADAYLLTGDRLGDLLCLQLAGDAGKTDDHFVTMIATGQPVTIPSALRGLVQRNGSPGYTFSAYDCARILIDAIDRAIQANGGKIPTREQVREAVAATTNFKGITGTYSFDANGDVENPGFSFFTLKQGSWAFWRSP